MKHFLTRPNLDLKEDREKLFEWAQIPGTSITQCLGIDFYNFFSPIGKQSRKLGTIVQISLMIQNLEADLNRDGNLSDEEKLANAEKDKEMVDQFVNCVGTCGVIGALVFSGLCGTVLNPVTPSNVSLQFFGHTTITNLSYLYYALLYSAFLLSCYVVVISFVIFLAVTIWMPNRDLRSWYIRKASALVRLIFAAAGTIVTTFFAVLIGVAINVGPIPGVISLIIVLFTLIFGIGEFAHMAGISCEALHIYCRDKLFHLDNSPEKKIQTYQQWKQKSSSQVVPCNIYDYANDNESEV